jgi:hypothetical protein
MNILCRLIGAALLLSLMLSLGSEAALAQRATQTPQKKTTPKAKPAAAANANAAAANANAAAANSNMSYSIGEIVPAIPAGCAVPVVNGTTYYLCSGANGVFYRVVPTS